MQVLIPKPITETELLDTSAGALLDLPAAENTYPDWVLGAPYEVGQRYAYDGDTYECIKRVRNKRAKTPDVDTRHWMAVVVGVTRAAWVSAAAYTTADIVYYEPVHRVYQALQNHTGITTPPNQDPENWLDIGPTNPWAMFDESNGTRTAGPSPLTWTLQPGIVTGMAMLNIYGASQIDIVMYDGSDIVYASSIDVADEAIITSWFDYFFEEIVPTTDVVIDDLPPYNDATIEISVTGADTVAVGNCIVGMISNIARTENGANLGIIDYSRKETDQFGETAIVERTFARKQDVNVVIDNTRLDYIYSKLSSLRATPSVWFEEELDFQSMILFGTFRDFNIAVQYQHFSLVSISLEGLT